MVNKIQLVELYNNDKIYVFEKDFIGDTIEFTKKYYEEKDILSILRLIIKKGLIFYDIGANIGNHSLYFSRRMKAKQVYSFEPIPFIFNVLEKNAQLVHNITTFNFGLSSLKQKLKFNLPGEGIFQDIVNYGTYRVDTIQQSSESSNTKIIANLEVLDHLVLESQSILPPDFIKIDVENFEMEVLIGAIKTITAYKPIVFIESFPNKHLEVHTFLSKLGYKKQFSFSCDNYLYTHPQGVQIKIKLKYLAVFLLFKLKVKAKYKKIEEKIKKIFKN